MDPVDELVLTILSQSTADTNSLPAFESLLNRFKNWDAVRTARVSSIASAIKRAGLANQKAPRIKRLLAELKKQHGRITLDHLNEMSDREARDYLTSFDGVGPKTAACVLLFACGRPVLPVDTHVHRVSQRLHLIAPQTPADAAHELLQDQLDDGDVLDFHVLLVRHGRACCDARRPRCNECVLVARCPGSTAFRDAGATAQRKSRRAGG